MFFHRGNKFEKKVHIILYAGFESIKGILDYSRINIFRGWGGTHSWY